MPHRSAGWPTGLASVGVGHLAWLVKAGKKRAHPTDRSLMIGHIFRIGSKIKHTQGRRTYQGAKRSIFPNSPDYGRNISKAFSLKMPKISPPDFYTFLRSCPCGINLKWRVPWVAPLKKLPSKNLAQKCLCNSGMLTIRCRTVRRPANLDGRGVM